MNCFRTGVSDACGVVPVQSPDTMNPLVLAYVGDGVFELFVRTMLVDAHDVKAHALHVMSSGRVRASSQAAASRRVFEYLSEEEKAVFIRGRNAKPGTVPKNADIEDYSLATALEAVIGYVYLKGDEARLMELMRLSIDSEEIVDKARPRPYKG